MMAITKEQAIKVILGNLRMILENDKATPVKASVYLYYQDGYEKNVVMDLDKQTITIYDEE
jgi:hypothetical protein